MGKKKPPPPSSQIEVVCPYCHQEQTESRYAVSTFCRQCGHNFKIVQGKGVTPSKDTLGTPQEIDEEISFFSHLFHREKARQIDCFQCGHHFTASAAMKSSQCPKCSNYVSLENVKISSESNRNIKTRGNVIIGRRGHLRSKKLFCGYLKVRGQLDSAVDCSGKATLKMSGKIHGTFRCKELIIERGSEIEFGDGIYAQTVEVKGITRGKIFCQQLLVAKRGEIVGDIQTKSIVIEKGGALFGQLTIPEPLPAPSKSPKAKKARRKKKGSAILPSAPGLEATS